MPSSTNPRSGTSLTCRFGSARPKCTTLVVQTVATQRRPERARPRSNCCMLVKVSFHPGCEGQNPSYEGPMNLLGGGEYPCKSISDSSRKWILFNIRLLPGLQSHLLQLLPAPTSADPQPSPLHPTDQIRNLIASSLELSWVAPPRFLRLAHRAPRDEAIRDDEIRLHGASSSQAGPVRGAGRPWGMEVIGGPRTYWCWPWRVGRG